MVNIIQISAFKDNYIWLMVKNGVAVVVDPGDASPVLDVLRREGLDLAAILITHHHHDHQGGISSLLAHYPRAQVYGSASESITSLSVPLKAGDMIFPFKDEHLGFRVYETPGHTAHHLCYVGGGMLFCGDTLFSGGCGRVMEGSFLQMYESLAQLAALPKETLVFCAHEYTEANLKFAFAVEPHNPDLQARIREVQAIRRIGKSTVPSTIAIESLSNPFLRCSVPEVVKSATEYAGGEPLKTPDQVFKALRLWKNSF